MSAESANLPLLPRLYCPQLSDLRHQACLLDAEQTRHARRVLRLSVGATVELIDGNGAVAQALIESYEGDRTRCQVVWQTDTARPLPTITIASAVPKGPRAEEMVDQLSQLGADCLIPLRTERSVVHPRPARIDRFRRRAREAVKQSRHPYIMTVQTPCELTEVLAEPADLRLVLHLGAVSSVVVPSGASSILAVVGPEGGWTDGERAACGSAGFIPWTISPHVLRVETAAAVAVALLRYQSI